MSRKGTSLSACPPGVGAGWRPLGREWRRVDLSARVVAVVAPLVVREQLAVQRGPVEERVPAPAAAADVPAAPDAEERAPLRGSRTPPFTRDATPVTETRRGKGPASPVLCPDTGLGPRETDGHAGARVHLGRGPRGVDVPLRISKTFH